jgi:hypothetical protein
MLIETVTVAGLLLAAEAGLAGLVLWLKRDCPWLITRADLKPKIDRDGLARFVAHGWDAELGWVRKPNTENTEIGKGGTNTHFRIDETGARADPGYPPSPLSAIALGDSYTFCRQVNDDETWPHFLSRALSGRVRNIGVGNYGIDQALLRLEREFYDTPAPIVIMGVVPETICRIQSVWKHFSEYGNVFAFKPRFRLTSARTLELLPNPIKAPDDFLNIPALLPGLKCDDGFYLRKFARDLLGVPYLYRLLRSWRRNLPLVMAALADRIGSGGNMAFTRVMRHNIRMSADLYSDPDSRLLLEAIVRRFSELCRQHHARPILVFTPQLLDLELLRSGEHFYADFLERVANEVEVLDMAPFLIDQRSDPEMYIEDNFGGHLSKRGNQLVADQLARLIEKAPPPARTAQ